MNPRLRTIIADAKAANMPAENIKRAIRRGTGEEPGVSYEEVTYEAYGPGGAAVIIDTLTDNKNRTVGELRHMLEKHGGNLASSGAVSWMFTKKGYIVVEKSKADEEKLMGAVLEAGADDLQDDGDNWEVLSAPEAFQGVRDAVKQLGHRTRFCRSLDDSAELREARRQGRATDGEADGRARRPRRRAARVVELRHRGEGDRGLARVKVFGIDPGSARTGYGCVQSDGSRHRMLVCGAIANRASSSFPEKLRVIHAELSDLIARHQPDIVAIENLFHAVNARTALKLGHARGVAMLAAVEAGVPIVEYTPAEVKQSVVGYGRAEKGQVQSMVQLLLGLREPPTPFDASDALAIAVCHLNRMNLHGMAAQLPDAPKAAARATSWRAFRLPAR